MTQRIAIGIKQLCEDANGEIDQTSADAAVKMLERDDVTIVDIRDVRELWRDGRVPGAMHVPRGMLEFWIDPDSPYHKPAFAQDRHFVFMCAGGMRSALATQTAKRMGLNPVSNLTGGFRAWKEAGGQVEVDPNAPERK